MTPGGVGAGGFLAVAGLEVRDDGDLRAWRGGDLDTTLVPVLGCRRVTEAVPVSGGGGGEVAGASVGGAVAAMGAVCGADEQPAIVAMATIAVPAATFNLWVPQAI